MNELAGYFPRLAIMQKGKIVYDGPMEEAWPTLGRDREMGVREPQSVKLGRLLGLSELTSDKAATARRIAQECVISRTAVDESLTERETATSAKAFPPGRQILRSWRVNILYIAITGRKRILCTVYRLLCTGSKSRR